jgi:putative hydrolase of the HAD superfamily
MRTLLEAAHVDPERASVAAEALLLEQPTRNLWRRPIVPMIALCRDLVSAGVPVGVISNSEGHLTTLLDQMGLLDLFRVVADSGRVGFEKPDRRIFDWFAERLGVPLGRIVHVGDSPSADVDGAIAAGMEAIWFDPGVRRAIPPHALARRATSADEVRSALRALGLGA